MFVRYTFTSMDYTFFAMDHSEGMQNKDKETTYSKSDDIENFESYALKQRKYIQSRV